MIPKVIHYCWFGGKALPKSAIKCINSWKKYLPEFEIVEWNEGNFDVNMIPYTSKAYKMKKYAFVSDYARLWIIYNYGGVYFDTDVEVLKPLDDIISKGGYMGVEKKIEINRSLLPGINPGLGFGAPAKSNILKELLDYYSKLDFYFGEGSNFGFKTIVENTTEVMLNHGFRDFTNDKEIQYCDEFYVYPKQFFCPDLVDNRWIVTEDTYSIHHFAATWTPLSYRLKVNLVKHIPSGLYSLYKRVFRKY